MAQKYTTISIPLALAERMDSVLKKGGYQNRADFAREAIRRLVLEIKERHT